MDMVERVARALCRYDGYDPDKIVGVRPLQSPQWDLYRKRARAAIEVMREPTEEMVEAAELAGGMAGWDHIGKRLRNAWSAAIDVAIKKAPTD